MSSPSDVCSGQTLAHPLYSQVINEECLQQLPADFFGDGSCPVEAANNVFEVLMGESRIEGWALGIFTLLLLFMLNLIGGVPNAKESPKCYFLHQFMQLMMYMWTLCSLILLCGGYDATRRSFKPCLVEWNHGLSLLDVATFGSLFLQAPILFRIWLMQTYAWGITGSANLAAASFESTNTCLSFCNLLHLFLAWLAIGFSVICWLVSVSILFSVAFLPITFVVCLVWVIAYGVARLLNIIGKKVASCSGFILIADMTFWADEQTWEEQMGFDTALFLLSVILTTCLAPMMVFGVWLTAEVYGGSDDTTAFTSEVYTFVFSNVEWIDFANINPLINFNIADLADLDIALDRLNDLKNLDTTEPVLFFEASQIVATATLCTSFLKSVFSTLIWMTWFLTDRKILKLGSDGYKFPQPIQLKFAAQNDDGDSVREVLTKKGLFKTKEQAQQALGDAPEKIKKLGRQASEKGKKLGRHMSSRGSLSDNDVLSPVEEGNDDSNL